MFSVNIFTAGVISSSFNLEKCEKILNVMQQHTQKKSCETGKQREKHFYHQSGIFHTQQVS